jgi:FtsZ-binding cell division protein ZapB
VRLLRVQGQGDGRLEAYIQTTIEETIIAMHKEIEEAKERGPEHLQA